MSGFQTENLGRRIARLRGRFGFTQQQLAGRLAISRNAVSHIETGLSQPSERTVVLLAGLFRLEPHDLVAGTDYPPAKADRLPAMAARYTETEARLGALSAERRWIEQLPPPARAAAWTAVATELQELQRLTHDPEERQALRTALAEVTVDLSRAQSDNPAEPLGA